MTNASGATHLVDKLNKASLFDLALDQGAAGPRRAYAMPSKADITGLFPDLEIQDLIGFGGMGCVYRARQVRLDRTIALKILPKELARDELFAERFAREARAMARLNHPNVVRVYDFGYVGDICYLIMEHMDGMNLRELLDAGRLPPDEAFRIFEQVGAALEYAHQEGVIHRDIKPENILFSRVGHVSLADFGLARLAVDSGCEVSLTQTRQAMGTLNYMAPEQWDDPKTVDSRADIYAMGILLYELLTGRVPRGSFPPASTLVPLPAAVDDVIHRALQVDPERRFATVRDMISALLSAVTGTSPADGRDFGTLTKVVNFAGILKRKTPAPAVPGSTAVPRQAEQAFAVSLFMTIAIGLCSLFPWLRNEDRYVPGIVSMTHVEHVEIPNVLILVATFAVTVLMKFRQKVHPIRAHLIAFVITAAAIALSITILVCGSSSGSSVSGVSEFDELPLASTRITVVPFFVLALLIFQEIEILIRLFQIVILPAVMFVFRSLSDHFRRKEERRRLWWQDRWSDARRLLSGKTPPKS